MSIRDIQITHQLLVVSEDDREALIDHTALLEAGYHGAELVTVDAFSAAEYLYGIGAEKAVRMPSLILVDLDCTKGEGKERLRKLLEIIKNDMALKLVPVLLLTRESEHENAAAWYALGINAVAPRPDARTSMVEFFKSIKLFWSENAVLPNRNFA